MASRVVFGVPFVLLPVHSGLPFDTEAAV